MSSRLITFLAALSLIVIAGVSGWTIRTLLRAESAATSPYVVARLGQTRLVYEAAYARSPAARQGGVIDALDLAARFPDFVGAGADFHSKPESIVFLDLEPATEGDAPEDRMARLYARFLESEPWSNPGGLVMRRFMPDSPYAGEELYFAPPEGRVFTARCTRPAQPPDAALESCLYDVRVGPIDAHVRFRPELIGDWEALSNGARALVQRIQR
jgi:hypothetical protein